MKMTLTSFVLIAIFFNSFTLQAGKEEARDVATGGTVIGGLGVATGVGAAFGAGMCIGQGVSLIGMGLWNAFASASTKPSSNYTSQATVVPCAFVPIGGTGPEIVAINQSLVTGSQVIGDSRLVYESLRRYYGALNGGDSASAEMQKNWTMQFFSQLENNLLVYRASLAAITPLLIGSIADSMTATVADVIAFRDSVVFQQAFPTWEQFVFIEMNATPDEIALAIGEVAQLTGTTITDSDLKGSIIFAGMATALGYVDLDTLMPPGFLPDSIPIPTLSQWGVIILILLLLAVGMVFIYQRQTSLALAGKMGDAEVSGAKPELFNKKLFLKVYAIILLVGIVGLAIAFWYFGSINNADPFGTIVSAGIIAYMIHLWMLRKSES